MPKIKRSVLIDGTKRWISADTEQDRTYLALQALHPMRLEEVLGFFRGRESKKLLKSCQMHFLKL